MTKHVALVFAKEGSIGFPGKNMYPIKGKPLIAFTLEELLNSNLFDAVFVSTNGESISEYCLKYDGVEVILRNDTLAKNGRFIDAVDHAINNLEQIPDSITIPQVVQPIKERGIFQKVLSHHNESVDSVVTVKRLESSLEWMYYIDQQKKISIPEQLDLSGNKDRIISRENDLVEIDNAIVSFTYKSWQRGESITPWPYLGNNIIGIEQKFMNRNMCVDLHIPEDGEWLEFIMEFEAWKRNRK